MARTWSTGSGWHRWDPHLHPPGTLLNDQYGGDWPGFFRAIEAAVPRVEAIGITDYFTLRGYKEFIAQRPASSFSWPLLAFPNVELRLSLQTRDGSGVNLHFLVAPDDPAHVVRVEEQLAKLTFRYRDATYSCTDESLRRLGRTVRNDDRLPDEAALSVGANQFKADLTAVRRLFEQDGWLRANVLVAVAAGQDGLSGLAAEASFDRRKVLSFGPASTPSIPRAISGQNEP